MQMPIRHIIEGDPTALSDYTDLVSTSWSHKNLGMSSPSLDKEKEILCLLLIPEHPLTCVNIH